ncbi:hypothetical protein [Cellulomonas sp. RIT-PI-Y]|uniref:hypothetical protein n=1 Tax=Cellulomonas sp. RIT-PI-Y TaxID=3035297 RepID=UPI0021D96B77|nr:hypothetical protein [Cellulomonas sp. RIT-PI-Y]
MSQREDVTGAFTVSKSGAVWLETAHGSMSFGVSAEQEAAALVRGRHFTEWSDIVRQLKREGRLEEALALLDELIAAAERSADGREPAPWYTEQAAIIHRRLKQYDHEVAVLERYRAACPPGRGSAKIRDRLVKARQFQRGSRS